MKDGISPRQKKFADEYIKTGIAEKAAIAAGYSEKTARSSGARLLTNAGVSQYIKDTMDKLSKPTIASADEVLQYLTRVMRGEEKDQFGLDASLSDRTKAAEDLGKRYDLFNKIQLEVTGSIADRLKRARERHGQDDS